MSSGETKLAAQWPARLANTGRRHCWLARGSRWQLRQELLRIVGKAQERALGWRASVSDAGCKLVASPVGGAAVSAARAWARLERSEVLMILMAFLTLSIRRAIGSVRRSASQRRPQRPPSVSWRPAGELKGAMAAPND